MEDCTYGLLLRVRASSYLNKQPILVFHGTTPADLIEKARQFLQTTSDLLVIMPTVLVRKGRSAIAGWPARYSIGLSAYGWLVK
jgi:hypothetical protein